MQTEYSLLIALGALLLLSPLVKSLMERIGMPALVGYILLGFLVGILNQQWSFISATFKNTFAVLAQLGVVALLFRVGLKSHVRALLAKLPDASLIWIGDVLTNLLFGFVVSHYLISLSVETSLVIAAAFSATSVAVSVAVWDELHKLNTSNGRLLVDVAELDDLSGVLLLAVLLALIPILQEPEAALLPSLGTTAVALLVKLLLFITGCYLFSYYLEPAFARFIRRWENSTIGLTISVLGAGLAIAGVAGHLGFSVAIGALFAGLAFSRDPQAVHTDAKFAYFYEFLTPFFFINIGMQINPEAVAPSLGLAAILFVPAVLAKFIGVAGPALRIVKRPDAVLLGLSMIPRAEIAMVVVYQCRQLGDDIVTETVFGAMVVVSVMTSILAPLILRSMLVRQSANN
jgi:Kef-type K+ transport system membrane component KefB